MTPTGYFSETFWEEAAGSNSTEPGECEDRACTRYWQRVNGAIRLMFETKWISRAPSAIMAHFTDH
jgi:hypothetical protein